MCNRPRRVDHSSFPVWLRLLVCCNQQDEQQADVADYRKQQQTKKRNDYFQFADETKPASSSTIDATTAATATGEPLRRRGRSYIVTTGGIAAAPTPTSTNTSSITVVGAAAFATLSMFLPSWRVVWWVPWNRAFEAHVPNRFSFRSFLVRRIPGVS